MEYGEYICEAYLKSQRGWTDSLIRDFLGEPDKTIPNPHCPTKGKRDIKLYSMKRVRDMEAWSEFQKRFSKARELSEAHRRVDKKLEGIFPRSSGDGNSYFGSCR